MESVRIDPRNTEERVTSSTSQGEGNFPPEKMFELGLGLGGQREVPPSQRREEQGGKGEVRWEGQETQEQQ